MSITTQQKARILDLLHDAGPIHDATELYTYLATLTQPETAEPSELRELALSIESQCFPAIEWRVADQTGAYCMSFGRDDASDPEREARDWLAGQQRDYPGRYAPYTVQRVEVLTRLQQDAKRAAALLRQMAERGRATPEGWQMVPKEPERAMWEAGAAHIIRLESDDDRDEQDDRYTAIGCAVAIYKDMLAAAPVPAETVIPAGQWLDRVLDLIDECPGLTMEQVRWLSRRVRGMQAEPVVDIVDTYEGGPYYAATEPPVWAEVVEQRLLAWRQRFVVTEGGDQLALDDFMDQESIDDLIDFVCDGCAAPAAPAPACIGKNPACPCQDGDACHYTDAADGTKGMPIPAPADAVEALRELVAYVDEPAGFNAACAADTDSFVAFMDAIEQKRKAIVERARAALAAVDKERG